MAHRKLRTLAVSVIVAALASVSAIAAGPDESTAQIQRELERTRGATAQVVNQLNQANPLAQVSPTPPGESAPLLDTSQISPELMEKLQYVQKLLQNPFIQKYMRIMTDPAVQRDLFILVRHPNRTYWLLAEAIWFLAIMVLKVRLMMRSKGVFKIIFNQLWTFALFLSGIVYIIPVLVFGDDYTQFVHAFIQAVQR